MAGNLFNPEVSGIGGSNVSAQEKPVVDYSRFIANIPEIFGVDYASASSSNKVTEGDLKRTALDTVSAAYQKASQIEDPVKRTVTMRKLEQSSVVQFPAYQDDIQKFFNTQKGFDNPELGGKTAEELKAAQITEWVTKDPNGQLAVAAASHNFPNDPKAQSLALESEYFNAKKVEADIANVGKSEVLLRPILQTEADKIYKDAFNPEAIQRIVSEANASGIDPTVALSDRANVVKLMAKNALSSKINNAGLDPSKVNVDSFLSGFDVSIQMAKDSADYIKRSELAKAEKKLAVAISMSPYLNPMFTIDLLKNNGQGSLGLIATQADDRAGLGILIKNMNIVAEHNMASASGSMTPQVPRSTVNLTPTDSPSTFTQTYANLAPPDRLEAIFRSSGEAKVAARDIGWKSILGFPLSNPQPEDVETASRNIGTMFISALPQIDTQGQSTKSFRLKQMLGNRTFEVAKAINTKDPVVGQGLYTQINTFTANAAARIVSDFKASMSVLRAGEVDPFIIKINNGIVTFDVNPEAVGLDPDLQKAMGSMKVETKAVTGRQTKTEVKYGPVTETDPKKILDNYVSLRGTSSFGQKISTFFKGDQRKDILDYVESLNTIAIQSEKIPPEIRKSADPLEIIRMAGK